MKTQHPGERERCGNPNPAAQPLLAAMVASLLFALVGVVLIGCRSPRPGHGSEQAGEDVAAYRQIVVHAMEEIRQAQRSLDQVCIEAVRNPGRASGRFADSVERLEVASISMRARVEAVKTRGGAYFEQWQARLAASENEGLRKRAQDNAAALHQCFERIRAASQQAREAFRPFLAGLKQIRAGLENDPTLHGVNLENDRIRKTQQQGSQVVDGLESILTELNAVAEMLSSPRPGVPPRTP